MKRLVLGIGYRSGEYEATQKEWLQFSTAGQRGAADLSGKITCAIAWTFLNRSVYR